MADSLVHALTARDLASANDQIARMLGPDMALKVDVVENARAAEAAPVWRVDAPGQSRFRFHEKIYSQWPALLFERWVSMLPLIARAMAHVTEGSCSFNLGDEGHRPGLAFCAAAPGYALIPDCAFMKEDGYAAVATAFAARCLPWRERRPVLFWRGATTGRRTGGVLDLPRVRLCLLAAALGERADVGVSGVSPDFPGEEQVLRAAGVLRDYVPPDRLDHYQLHIDIDGNTNSWPGLLMKLHSGSPVLKVQSAHGYRQWYYDRLRPWENYVPVRADMADLAEIADHLFAHPDLAERIGAAGRALAQSMTVEAEVERAVPTIADALRAGHRAPGA